MTPEEIKIAAKHAVLAMSDAEKEAFIEMVDGGNAQTADVSRAFAVEGTRRQIAMSHMALERPTVMCDLTEVVYEKLAAE